MQTLLTKKQQQEWLNNNRENATWVHKWSTRGYGNSKIVNGAGDVIGKASGCGYDRYGTAIGEAMTTLFPAEILKLAKRECKGPRREYRGSETFYGLFYNAKTGRAWVDGGCGSSCMVKILKKIGFSLEYVGESERSNTGEQFYRLVPITAHDRKYFY
jgi:hypothetical protein